MYTDWKNYFNQYIPAEEHIPDNISSKALPSIAFFIILGAIASIGLISKVEGKSDSLNKKGPEALKVQKIKNSINSFEKKNAILESEILILNHKLTQTLEKREKNEVIRLSGLTGTSKVTGEGIMITLKDNDQPLKPGENPNIGIIHNTDLLQIINSLWTAGAKAMSINGQRITALSEINCIGPTIMINKTRIISPFILKAVGNAKILSNSLKNSHLDELNQYGIKYSLESFNQLEIPANSTIILSGDF